MKQSIIDKLNDPSQLEILYRRDPYLFKKEFNEIYPDLKGNVAAQVWHERLNYTEEIVPKDSKKDLIFAIAAAFIAGLIAKIPDFTGMDPEYFYPRNIGFIVFPFLAAYFVRKHELPLTRVLLIAAAFVFLAVYINLLPDNKDSHTLTLSCIHQLLILWALFGIAFLGNGLRDTEQRISFLRFNGDLVVMTTIILIGGVILAGLTLSLFRLIDINAADFYFRYVGIFGLAAAPVIATFLVRSNPQLVSRVSPVIAIAFTPLVLITLIVYLLAVIVTGKDPYNDRESLLIFNLLLIGVMALILFSLAEKDKGAMSRFRAIMLTVLSVVTIIVNVIALSAIIFRISEWGISPNKLAVLAGNVLMLVNLLLVTYKLLRSFNKNISGEDVAGVITAYLPVYCIWAVVVTFIFPVAFGFR